MISTSFQKRLTFHQIWLIAAIACALGFSSPTAAQDLTINQILDQMEQRYSGGGFSADFLQESTIKAMQITDLAQGKIFVKYPGMMRWEYETPEAQVIITDGHKLWVYRPEDNQVMTGGAPAFFRDGTGASFLSDIKIVRRKFNISLASKKTDLLYELKLIPLEKSLAIADIRLKVTKQTFTVVNVATVNGYGDDTRIEMINVKFNADLDNSLFSFEIPEGVDVLKLDE